MKILVMGAALATLLASSALAQSFNPEFGTGNVGSSAAGMNGGRAMAMPSYPEAIAQPSAADRLNGIRAEAPKTKRHHAKPASQQ